MAEFVSSEEYNELSPTYYDDLLKSRNPVRRNFHKKRFDVTLDLVRKYRKGYGDVIVDLACGSCNWNKMGYNVIGVDVAVDMLKYATFLRRVRRAVFANCYATYLEPKIADVVIMCELLEHLEKPKETLKEARRLLKDDGIIIVSVPYDVNLSLWKPLFKALCFLEGTIKGKEYFKKEAGHINHFSKGGIIKLIEEEGFKIVESSVVNLMTTFVVAKKDVTV